MFHRIYKKVLYLLTRKLFDDIAGQIWENAYTVGFEEGSDSIVSDWDDFRAGYALGYSDSVKGHPRLYAAQHREQEDPVKLAKSKAAARPAKHKQLRIVRRMRQAV